MKIIIFLNLKKIIKAKFILILILFIYHFYMSFRNNQNNHHFPKDIYFTTLKSSNSLTRTSTSKNLNCFPSIQDQNNLRNSQNQNKKLIFSSYNSRRKISSSIDSPLFLSQNKK